MITLSHDCPHCDTRLAGFTLVGESKVPGKKEEWHAFLRCNVCHGPLAVTLLNAAYTTKLADQSGNLASGKNFSRLRFFPLRQPSSAPAHIPESVSRAFIQAEDAIKRQHWEAAGAMDRRALEIATKEMAPEHAGLSLYARIEKLAKAGKLTESLKDWAHDLRLFGNDALHEIEGVSRNEATQAHELTRFTLTYLYTLPKQVELARVERENGN